MFHIFLICKIFFE